MTRQTVLAVHSGADLFGSDRMFLESVIGLCDAGHDVVVALPHTGPLVPELQAAGARVVVLPMLVLRRALLRPTGWLSLARDGVQGFVAARRLLSRVRPTAVYVSTITLPHWPVTARMFRARVSAHVHEAEGHVNRLINAATYASLAAAHTVIVNSDYARQVLGASLPGVLPRSEVIYNGVSSPADPAPPRATMSGPLRLCYVGRLSPRKGPDLVIEAARLLAQEGCEVTVSLVGSVYPGTEWFERELRAQAASLPDGAEVVFEGFSSNVWPHVADADIAVVPSRLNESFGNTAVEGVLALRPVVASDNSGLREAVGQYATARLVTPDSARELADACKEVRADWETVCAQVTTSRTRALARHAPERYRAAVSHAVTGVDTSGATGIDTDQNESLR